MESGNITLEALWNRLGNIEAQNAGNHNEVRAKLDNIQVKFNSVTDVLNDHTKQLGSLDYDKRRKNLVIYGVSEEQTNLENILMTLFCTHMKIQGFSLMEIDFCRRLGKEPNHSKPRPILVGLTTQRRKIEILKNSPSLKGTTVFVKQDISPGAREAQKKLREERNNLRSQGKNAVIRKGKLICYDNNYDAISGLVSNHTQSGTSGLNQNNKRAPSQSPSDIPDNRMLKKSYHNMSEGSDLLSMSNGTVIETEPFQRNQDLFSDTSSNFATPAQSPRSRIPSNRNLHQSSIVSYLTVEKN
ncbi:hypothetical protein M8J77_023406 [Diaphorina citri]|nr:hypothetical protein M8J77_011586 [Diaphorina citri]KAI5728933.1 hypothetical protein M8J77_023406 [Diaphorina citri]